MGNCQATEVATVVIQHPGEGRTERAYWALSAGAVMAANPGHYVAAVITSPPDPTSSASSGVAPVKHLKLLRPDDTLLLGRVYRLVSFEEVLREFTSKRHVKLSRVTIKAKDDDGKEEEEEEEKTRARNPRRRRASSSSGGERKQSERSLAKVMRQAEEEEPGPEQQQQHEPAGHSPGPGDAPTDDLDRDLEALVPPHGLVVGRRFARQWRPALQSIAEG